MFIMAFQPQIKGIVKLIQQICTQLTKYQLHNYILQYSKEALVLYKPM